MTQRLENYKKYFDFILSCASPKEIEIAEAYKSYFMLIGKYTPNMVNEIVEFNGFCLLSGYNQNGFYTKYEDYRQGLNVFDFVEEVLTEEDELA